MFEGLAKKMSKEMMVLSKGALHCLPYSRALLDFFKLRGKAARPLVVRCVVFGRLPAATTWGELPREPMIKEAIHGPVANGIIKFTPKGPTQTTELTVPFRTLGFPHSGGDENKTLGNFENGWLGHLVVLADNTVIDMTIGQLNNQELSINFAPPYVMVEADEGFLSGKSPIIAEHDGMLLSYFAYPKEKTYKNSESSNDAKSKEQLRTVAKRVADSFGGKPDTELHGVGPSNHSSTDSASPIQPS